MEPALSMCSHNDFIDADMQVCPLSLQNFRSDGLRLSGNVTLWKPMLNDGVEPYFDGGFSGFLQPCCHRKSQNIFYGSIRFEINYPKIFYIRLYYLETMR